LMSQGATGLKSI